MVQKLTYSLFAGITIFRGGFLARLFEKYFKGPIETIVLGAVFVHDHRLGMLSALFIGLWNLPESFNAYFDLRKSNQAAKHILIIVN